MRSSRIRGIIKVEVCVIWKASADNTNRGLNNFSYPTRTEFNNCFIIYLYLRTFPLKKPFVFSRIWHKQLVKRTSVTS